MLDVKVLVVDHNAVLSSDRGLYRALNNMDGIELSLVVPFSWKEHFGRIHFQPEDGTLQVRPVRTYFTGRTHRALYPSLGKILRRIRPDILYVNSEPEGYLAWQAVRLRDLLRENIKVVFDSWRNIDYTSSKFPYKFSWLNARAERAVLSRADHCIAHNERAREIYEQKGFNKVTVIPPAVDMSIFKRGRDPLNSWMRLKGFTIGFVGRFIPEKGVEVLLRAMKSLPFEFTGLFVGDGPATSLWWNLTRELHIENSVIWAGAVRHDEIPSYLSVMDVLILPSSTGTAWKEQFGRVLIEAMACETPVIGSSSGEIPNVIGNAGLIFQEGDVAQLREHLILLWSNREKKQQLSARGLESARSHFSIPVVAEKYRRLFHRLTEDDSRS